MKHCLGAGDSTPFSGQTRPPPLIIRDGKRLTLAGDELHGLKLSLFRHCVCLLFLYILGEGCGIAVMIKEAESKRSNGENKEAVTAGTLT
jgi:hypothetical protein